MEKKKCIQHASPGSLYWLKDGTYVRWEKKEKKKNTITRTNDGVYACARMCMCVKRVYRANVLNVEMSDARDLTRGVTHREIAR